MRIDHSSIRCNPVGRQMSLTSKTRVKPCSVSTTQAMDFVDLCSGDENDSCFNKKRRAKGTVDDDNVLTAQKPPKRPKPVSHTPIDLTLSNAKEPILQVSSGSLHSVDPYPPARCTVEDIIELLDDTPLKTLLAANDTNEDLSQKSVRSDHDRLVHSVDSSFCVESTPPEEQQSCVHTEDVKSNGRIAPETAKPNSLFATLSAQFQRVESETFSSRLVSVLSTSSATIHREQGESTTRTLSLSSSPSTTDRTVVLKSTSSSTSAESSLCSAKTARKQQKAKTAKPGSASSAAPSSSSSLSSSLTESVSTLLEDEAPEGLRHSSKESDSPSNLEEEATGNTGSSSSSGSPWVSLSPQTTYEVRLLVDRRERANALVLASLQHLQVHDTFANMTCSPSVHLLSVAAQSLSLTILMSAIVQLTVMCALFYALHTMHHVSLLLLRLRCRCAASL